jgi:hypothetical protein
VLGRKLLSRPKRSRNEAPVPYEDEEVEKGGGSREKKIRRRLK